MKILRVISGMDPSLGGPSQGIRNSIPELQKLDIYNEVVSFDDEDAPFLKTDNFKVNAIGKSVGPWAYNKALVPWLINNLERFDVVIVHGLWLYQSYAVNKAVKLFKRKHPAKHIPQIYLMPHGMLDPYFQKAAGRKFKAVRNWIYWKLIEGPVVNAADGLLFTCEEELLLARETFIPYHPKKELNVSYGIKAPPVYTAEMQKDLLHRFPMLTNQHYMLFLSRIHPKKGLDLLINAYNSILASSQKNIPKLVIAGPGMDTLFGKELRNLAQTNKDSIIFTGMLTGNAKWAAIYGADVFILPSHQENFGIAIAEALACGKPILTTKKVNIWREIEQANCGIVADDTLSGTKLLLEEWLLMNEKGKKEISANAITLYKSKFDISSSAIKMADVLKSN